VDLWWGSYSPRTMAPVFVVCALLTAAVLLVGWLLGVWPGYNPARSIIKLGILGLWVCLLVLWVFRVVGINYRLTNRCLYVDRGFREPIPEGIALDRVQQVVVERNFVERWLGIGRIRILLADSSQPPTVMEGVADPEQIALLIREQVQRNRASDKVS
jgi:uncharacterized membrane protein YdbT with pleckstrin-like domain